MTIEQNLSTIYGPVNSWRFGQSLGVDLLYQSSICSFNCIYCQLGNIQVVTTDIKEYVSTQRVISDFNDHLKQFGENFEVITFSGNGEPTLASNLGEVSNQLRNLSKATQIVLTNGTLLMDSKVRAQLTNIDRVIVKLDAFTEEMFQKVNRPAEGVSLANVLKGADLLKKDYKGEIDLQVMVMPINEAEIGRLIEVIRHISPKWVQLNTPQRPYPLEWDVKNRGNHQDRDSQDYRKLKTITPKHAKIIEDEFRKSLPEINFTSIYRH